MKNRKGFTLISVVIAIVLLSIGVMSLAKSMFTLAKVTRVENQRTQALELATQYMEDLRGRDPWSLASQSATAIDSTGAVNVNGAFTRQTTVTDEGAQLLRVTITVTPRNNPRFIRLTTLIFKVIV